MSKLSEADRECIREAFGPNADVYQAATSYGENSVFKINYTIRLGSVSPENVLSDIIKQGTALLGESRAYQVLRCDHAKEMSDMQKKIMALEKEAKMLERYRTHYTLSFMMAHGKGPDKVAAND